MSSRFDAVATLNEEFYSWMQQLSLPAWMPIFPVVYNIPDTGIQTPSVSVHHIPLNSRSYGQPYVGTGNGLRGEGLLELNVWVSRTSPDYIAIIEWLTSEIERHYADVRSLQMMTFTGSPFFPMPTPYKINIETINPLPTAEDQNPDIERRRIMIRYSFVVRV